MTVTVAALDPPMATDCRRCQANYCGTGTLDLGNGKKVKIGIFPRRIAYFYSGEEGQKAFEQAHPSHPDCTTCHPHKKKLAAPAV